MNGLKTKVERLADNVKGYLTMLCEMTYTSHYEWHIALRKREKRIFESDGDGFISVPNDWRYWRADPFLFRYRDDDYVFVEMYDRWKEKGVIGVARIKNGKCGRFRVCLELPWHLSYPCVVEDEKGIHMVPECSASGELWMYRCRKFPMRWEKEKCIAKEAVADATPVLTERGRLWYATKFPKGETQCNNNLAVCVESGSQGNFEYVLKEDTTVRPAGHFIKTEEGWLRPAQNCTDTYGGNLEFRQVEGIGTGAYSEKTMVAVFAPGMMTTSSGIHVKCKPIIGSGYGGLHTYNLNDNYEVIDLKYRGGRSIICLIKNFKKHYFSRGKKER